MTVSSTRATTSSSLRFTGTIERRLLIAGKEVQANEEQHKDRLELRRHRIRGGRPADIGGAQVVRARRAEYGRVAAPRPAGIRPTHTDREAPDCLDVDSTSESVEQRPGLDEVGRVEPLV